MMSSQDLTKGLLDNSSHGGDSSSPKDSALKVYSVRWLVLWLFIYASFANSTILLTWSPIVSKADDYWGGIGETAVNLLTVSFSIMYIPGSYMASKILKSYDLRTSMIVAGAMQIVGCIIRYIGAIARGPNGISPVLSYVIILLGTLFVATAQPFYLNMPSKVSTSWFAVKERDTAMTMSSMANPLGSAMGTILSPIFVTGEGDHVKGVPMLMLTQLLIVGTSYISIHVWFQSEPPTPPTQAAAAQISERTTTTTSTTEVGNQELKTVISDLFKSKNYIILFVTFTLSLGHLNACAALLGQLPGDYSDTQYGSVGAALILTGFLGAVVIGFALEYTKAYRPVLKGAYVACILAWTFAMSNCRQDNFTLLIISAAILGFTAIPLIPATIANCSECTFPLPEDIAVGVLYIGANLSAIAFTFIGQELLTMDSIGPAPLFPYALWVIGGMALAAFLSLFYDGEYKRLNQDKSKPALKL